MPGPNAKPFDDWEADVRPRSACPHFSKTHSNRFGFDLVVESLRTFSPGLLALDLAYPRPSTTRTLYPLPLAHDSSRADAGKMTCWRQAVDPRGPGRVALGRNSADFRLLNKTRL